MNGLALRYRTLTERSIDIDADGRSTTAAVVGTRAAAATGGAMEGSHGPTIEINRPYLYVIRNQSAGTILFIGRVSDPTQAP